jgi:hypothetical protein
MSGVQVGTATIQSNASWQIPVSTRKSKLMSIWSMATHAYHLLYRYALAGRIATIPLDEG